MAKIASVDPVRLGRRLAEARKARGLTQQDAADHLRYSRPTLIAIEKGTRPARPEEIVALAALYGRKVHEIVRDREPVEGFQPQLRAAAGRMDLADEELDRAIDQLQQFAENYKILEDMLDVPMTQNYPPEVRLADRLNVVDMAEDAAVGERNRLGLGDQPVCELRRLLETDVGLRIMYGDLPSRIAGLYAYTESAGCCILVNRKHPPERVRASLAHEYGHVIVDRHRSNVDRLSDYRGRKPANERFAERFAMCFLMPATSVRRRFNEIVSASGDFRVADLCRLSHLYYVSVEAMAYRLEGLQLIPEGTIRYLKESNSRVLAARELLELPPRPESKNMFPDRYESLAVQAYQQAKISEGQLARFLAVDPVAAREVVERVSQGTDVTNEGEIQESRFDLVRSLLGRP
jgi:Zn-dependent peptidase ImmA (M78 family)/DNA-binding XRE family transcriptional regulator